MTSGYSTLQMKEDDVLKILAAQLHVGSKDVDYQMDAYVWKKKPRNEAASIVNIRKFWEKLVLAARAIVAVENPADVCCVSCQPQGKFSFKCFLFYFIIYSLIRTACCFEVCQIYRCNSYW